MWLGYYNSLKKDPKQAIPKTEPETVASLEFATKTKRTILDHREPPKAESKAIKAQQRAERKANPRKKKEKAIYIPEIPNFPKKKHSSRLNISGQGLCAKP